MVGFVIGVDGGGSKTSVALLSCERKTVVATARTGGSNWNSVGDQAAKEAISQGIHQCAKVVSIDLAQIQGVCLCMSGVDRPQDKQKVSQWISDIFGRNIAAWIHNDAVGALASCTGGILDGVAVISGTGMIAYGLRPNSQEARSGGWGPLLGDVGSGFGIGQTILKKVVASYDQRIGPTLLTGKTLEFLKIEAVPQLIDWAYDQKEGGKWDRWAALAPLAAQCAREGDQIAVKILENAANSLFDNINTVVKRLKFEESNQEYVIGFCGGNLTHNKSMLASFLEDCIRKNLKHAKVAYPKMDPAEAAAWIAFYRVSPETK